MEDSHFIHRVHNAGNYVLNPEYQEGSTKTVEELFQEIMDLVCNYYGYDYNLACSDYVIDGEVYAALSDGSQFIRVQQDSWIILETEYDSEADGLIVKKLKTFAPQVNQSPIAQLTQEEANHIVNLLIQACKQGYRLPLGGK